MSADLLFTIVFDSNGEPVLKKLSGGVDDLKGRFNRLNADSGGAAEGFGKLGRSANVLLEEIGAVGPLAQYGSTALRALGSAGLVAGGLLSAVAIGAKIGLAPLEQEIELLDKSTAALKGGNLQFFIDKLGDLKKISESREGTFAPLITGFQRLRGAIQGTDEALSNSQISKQSEFLKDQQFVAQKQKINEVTRAIRDQTDFVGKEGVDAFRAQGQVIERELIQKFRALGMSIDDAGKKAKLLAGELTEARVGKLFADVIKETDQFAKTLVLEGSAAGLTGTRLDALAAAQKKAGIEAKYAGDIYNTTRDKLLALADATDRYNRAQRLISTGEQAVNQFEQKFQTRFAFSDKNDAFNLAGQFVAVAKGTFDNPAERENLGQAFASFVQQSFSLGVKDIRGLLASAGVSDRIIEGLISDLRSRTIGQETVDVEVLQNNRNAFGGPSGPPTRIEQQTVDITGQALAGQIPTVRDSTEAWNKNDDALKKLFKTYGDVGTAADEFSGKIDKLRNEEAIEIAVRMDTSEADGRIKEIQDAIESIPERINVFVDFQSNIGGLLGQIENIYGLTTGLDFSNRIYN
jgi:hypothetical protein